jgi:hypothetical protein
MIKKSIPKLVNGLLFNTEYPSCQQLLLQMHLSKPQFGLVFFSNTFR